MLVGGIVSNVGWCMVTATATFAGGRGADFHVVLARGGPGNDGFDDEDEGDGPGDPMIVSTCSK